LEKYTVKYREFLNKLAENNQSDRFDSFPTVLEYFREYPIEMLQYICVYSLKSHKNDNSPWSRRRNIEKFISEPYPGQRLELHPSSIELARNIIIMINTLGSYGNDKKTYIPLIQYMNCSLYLKSEFILGELDKYQIDIERNKTKPKLWELVHKLFDGIADEYMQIIKWICTMVYRGLPLYRIEGSNKFVEISHEELDFTYIFMNGFYDTSPFKTKYFIKCWQFPAWTKKLYLKIEHVELLKQSYKNANNHEYHDDDKTIQLRRSAYRKAIGAKEVLYGDQTTDNVALNNFPAGYDTKLMGIQRKVLDRYYGDQFDIDDQDTWTSQNEVVRWIRKEYTLSDREAKAIDILTRPDQARGK